MGAGTISIVVPANAGTHTPRRLRLAVLEGFGYDFGRWLWVPAFAGTTCG
jgi:hypothetical protein